MRGRDRFWAWAAGAWSLAYGALGVWWASGGRGFPFGTGDPDGADVGSLLAGLRPGPGGALIAALGLAGAAVAVALANGWGRGGARRALLWAPLGLAGVLLLVVPDIRVLLYLGYLPAIVLRPDLGQVEWPALNQFLVVAGGLLWFRAAVGYGRTTRTAGDPARWARIGRWATAVAVLAPLPYAATRLAWAAGIPLGVPDSFIAMYDADSAAKGVGIFEYTLGAGALGGAILTLGLVQRWGEVFPFWIPGLRGRRVPPMLAVVPASIVSVALIVAGSRIFTILPGGQELEGWGPGLPAYFWLPWGLALAVATFAYQRRRAATPAPGLATRQAEVLRSTV